MNKQVIGIGVVAALAIATVGVLSVSAAEENFKRGDGSFSSERKVDMVEKFENITFEEFKADMEERHAKNAERCDQVQECGADMLANMTEEKFEGMKEMHQLMQDEKTEEAEALRESLGLPAFGFEKRGGEGFGMGMGRMHRFEGDVPFQG